MGMTSTAVPAKNASDIGSVRLGVNATSLVEVDLPFERSGEYACRRHLVHHGP